MTFLGFFVALMSLFEIFHEKMKSSVRNCYGSQDQRRGRIITGDHRF